ncbi:MAG TPA: hypothetical protein VJ697_16570 [Nitrososphaeraceae archaeon]|nr:hypothetical protein [Nitrososphaeraceae archaeon]
MVFKATFAEKYEVHILLINKKLNVVLILFKFSSIKRSIIKMTKDIAVLLIPMIMREGM